MTMLECVHQHVTVELRQGSYTDTVLVVTAVVFDLVVLAINSIIAAHAAWRDTQRREEAKDLVLQYEARQKIKQQQVKGSGRWWSGKQNKHSLKRCHGLPDYKGLPFNSHSTQFHYSDLFLLIFTVMTVLVNLVSLAALNTNRDSRNKLLGGLISMCKDENVDKYYDHSLLKNYSRRYRYFELVIIGLAGTALLVPIMIRM